MRTRRRNRGDSQNADSLLDTMANVVGILIVLMAVTQLTVNDAMKRIRVWESEEAVDLRESQEEARAQLASIGGIDLTRTLELARLREHIRELTGLPSKQETATVSADVARRRMQVRKLEASIAEKREQLANLQILLAEVEERAQEEGVALRLPDPRPAPLASRRVVLFSRYGRVFDPRFESLERELGDVVERAPRPLTRYFRAYDIGNELLRWQLVDDATGRVARLEWRHNEIGETLAELRSPKASFREQLAAYDPKSHFLLFYVWEDSFEVYLEARQLAEETGFAVGWQPLPNGRPLDFIQGGPVQPTPVD